jgi:hypothetical protein
VVVSFPAGKLGVTSGDLFEPTPNINQIGLCFTSYTLVHCSNTFYELFLSSLIAILEIVLFGYF